MPFEVPMPDERRFRERLGALLDQRARVASEVGWGAEAVEQDVARAVGEVRGDALPQWLLARFQDGGRSFP